MYEHSDIWKAVDRLAVTFGYSPSGLAKKAGLDPTTFNKSKRTSADGKPRWPSTESIAKILSVTGMSMAEFFSLTDGESAAIQAAGGKRTGATLPLIGYAQAGREGFFDADGYPKGEGWDEVEFPAPDARLYALEISGNSMEPLYRAGDVIVVSPGAALRRGDRVVLKTSKGEVMAKELVRQTAGRTELKSLNAEHEDLALKTADIDWIARIVWVSQ